MTKTLTPQAEKALSFPVGAVSPLWLMFAGAAAAGAAVFWARQWLKPVNVEAMSALSPLPPVSPEAAESVVQSVEEAVALAVETTDAMIEVAAEALETAAELAAETVETVVEASAPVEADDLTRLTGIGPKLAAQLAERGVTRFADIAAWTAGDVATFDREMKLMGRIDREAWIAQARRFAAG